MTKIQETIKNELLNVDMYSTTITPYRIRLKPKSEKVLYCIKHITITQKYTILNVEFSNTYALSGYLDEKHFNSEISELLSRYNFIDSKTLV